jgi:hypothetical protein
MEVFLIIVGHFEAFEIHFHGGDFQDGIIPSLFVNFYLFFLNKIVMKLSFNIRVLHEI